MFFYMSVQILGTEDCTCTPLYTAINIISGSLPVFVLKDENIYYS
jgi:hypothetical protein